MPNLAEPLIREQPNELHFRAMNTDVEIVLEADPGENLPAALQEAADWFRFAESTFSRFRPDSELSRINRLAGAGPILISATMLEVLEQALGYRERTDGAFDPLAGGVLERLGYDRSFEKLPADRLLPPASKPGRLPSGEALYLNPRMKSVQISAGSILDLGGIVKSWTVKRAALWLRTARGIRAGMINAGGDLTVWRSPGASDADWRIGIQNPWRPAGDIGSILLSEGSAATSGKRGRAWSTSLGPKHHLIDPAAADSARTPVVQCTVFGPDPVECEIWSKTVCILGSERGIGLMNRHAPGYEAIWFTEEGITEGTPSLLERLEHSLDGGRRD